MAQEQFSVAYKKSDLTFCFDTVLVDIVLFLFLQMLPSCLKIVSPHQF